jgi:hypothetical protein
MHCPSCGVENQAEATSCAVCGESLADRYAPPLSALGADRAVGDELQPWELKRWRVSGLSWAAMWLSVFVPPVGFVLSFFAVSVANRFRKRPGNRAVAYAALGTALYMGFIWGVVAFTIWTERQAAEAAAYTLAAPYGDPYAPGVQSDPNAPSPAPAPEDTAELQRLLEQLAQQPAEQPAPAE